MQRMRSEEVSSGKVKKPLSYPVGYIYFPFIYNIGNLTVTKHIHPIHTHPLSLHIKKFLFFSWKSSTLNFAITMLLQEIIMEVAMIIILQMMKRTINGFNMIFPHFLAAP